MVSFRRGFPFYRWVAGHRRRRNHVARLFLLNSLRPDQSSPLGVVHLWKCERIKLSTRINYNRSSKVKMTDLRLQIFAPYLRAAVVGSGSSQYQCMVLRLTIFAQVLSSGWVFEKIFLRKPNSLTSTCGCRLTAKKDSQNWLKVELYWTVVKIKHTRTGAYGMGVICPKLYRQACVRYPLDGTSNRHPLRRNSSFSNPYLSLEFHIWLSTTDSWEQWRNSLIVTLLAPSVMAPYRISIVMKILHAFGDIWLTDRPKHLRSSRRRELNGNLSPAFNICSYTPTPSTPS